jgi:hypothetical protein
MTRRVKAIRRIRKAIICIIIEQTEKDFWCRESTQSRGDAGLASSWRNSFKHPQPRGFDSFLYGCQKTLDEGITL